jgi:hypothetical protein
MLPAENYLYFPTFFWGIATLLAFVGLGNLLCAALGFKNAAAWGWGLHGVLGMSLVIFTGGISLLLGIGSSHFLIAIVLLGVGTWVYFTSKTLNNPKNELDFNGFLRNLPLWALVTIYYFGSVAWIKEIDPNDDLPGYYVFPHAILQMGTLLEEFSMRRACTFGGHQFLQALTSVFGSEKNFQFVDIGIAKVLLLGILSHALQDLRKKYYWIYLMTVALALTLHYPRINASGLQLPVVLSIALSIVLIDRASLIGKKWTPQAAFVCSLMIAAASTFRPQYALFTGALFTFWSLFSFGWRDWKSWGLATAAVGAGSFLLLTPWMALLYKAIGSPFMPPFLGGVNPTFLGIHSVSGDFLQKIVAALNSLLIPELLVFLPALLIFLLCKPSPMSIALLISTALTLVIFAYNWSAIPPAYLYRYTFPFLAAFWIPIFLELSRHVALQEDAQKSLLRKPFYVWLVVVIAACALQLLPAYRGLSALFTSIPDQIENKSPLLPPENYRFHRALQDIVPAGEPIFVMVDTPFMFDFNRNRIYNAEAVGQCSPWGGLPFFQGPKALREYLTKNGIKYVIFVKPNSAFMYYRKDYWANNPWVKQGFSFIAEYGKYVIDLSDNLTKLAKSSPNSKELQTHFVFELDKQ